MSRQVVEDDHVAVRQDRGAPTLHWDGLLAHGQLLLDSGRAHDGAELSDEAVAHELDYSAAVLGQQRLENRLPQIPQSRECAKLIGLDEAGIADHVGRHDGR